MNHTLSLPNIKLNIIQAFKTSKLRNQTLIEIFTKLSGSFPYSPCINNEEEQENDVIQSLDGIV